MKKALRAQVRVSIDKSVSVSLEDRKPMQNHRDILKPTSVANAQGGAHRIRVIVGV